MNTVEAYIQEVLHNIQAPAAERERIKNDLQAHFREAAASGQRLDEVLERMGSPEEVAAEFMAQETLNFAPFWARFAAWAVDMVILIVGAFLLAFPAVFLANQVPQHPEGAGYLIGALIILAVIAMVLSALGIILLYFPVLEGRFGQTLGKRIFRLRVRKENGLPIGYKEAFLRRLSFYFEFLPIDALFIFFTDKRQRALDIVARTIVLRS